MSVQKKVKQGLVLSILASSIAFSFSAMAFPAYEAGKSYSAGEKVTINGSDYQAKWWAEKGDSPQASVTNEWETPWKLISGEKPDIKEKDTSTTSKNTNEQVKEQAEKKDTVISDKAFFAEWMGGKPYRGGDTVSHLGKNYTCISASVAPWCSSAHAAYEPGVGFGWQQAWKIADAANSANENKPVDGLKPVDEVKPVEIVDPVDKTKPSDNDITDNNNDDETIEVDSNVTLPASQLAAQETKLTSSPLMQHAKASIATRDNVVVEAITPGANANPENVKRVENIVSSDKWDYIFDSRVRNPAYTYTNFLKAVGKFPRMCGNMGDEEKSDSVCRKTLATMFAHFNQETGAHAPGFQGVADEWRQGLHYVREVGWEEGTPNGYGECSTNIWQGKAFPCAKDSNGQYKSYFGRGAKQLSYNYNYGAFSQIIYNDVNVLLQHPERVADTWLNLASAVFFYLYPQSPKPSMQDVIDGHWQPNAHDSRNGLVHGFGVTTMVINGGVECGGSVEIAQSLNRIKYYKEFAHELGVPIAPTEVLGCKNMKSFDTAGAGAVNSYWEQDYAYNANQPGGKSFSCKLVNYQTPYSAFNKGDYAKCVQHFFPELKVTQ